MSSSANQHPILEVNGVTIRRGRTIVLRNLNWRVNPGEHWAILGANGSGKTSLLSALTGYLPATDGDISLLGETYGEADWRELRMKIGLVSSSLRLMMNDSETALETVVTGKYAMIDYWGKVKPADAREARRILKWIGCRHLEQRPWSVLSQGERQRILIARALMCRPRLLILDEPCAGLDPVAREHFLQFIDRLGRQPDAPTLVLVTHHVEEITGAFTHILYLKDGTTMQSGSKSGMLRSRLLAQAFQSEVRVTRQGDRYRMEVAPQSGGDVAGRF